MSIAAAAGLARPHYVWIGERVGLPRCHLPAHPARGVLCILLRPFFTITSPLILKRCTKNEPRLAVPSCHGRR